MAKSTESTFWADSITLFLRQFLFAVGKPHRPRDAKLTGEVAGRFLIGHETQPIQRSEHHSFSVSIAETNSVDDIERLLADYASLAKRQHEALQRCTYAQLSRRQVVACDARVLRIQEISVAITKLRSENS
jgi:hypothetical protein